MKTKARILIIAGAPSPDVAAIHQILLEEGHFTVHTRVQRSTDGFYEGSLSRTDLDSADCVVLAGYPSQAASAIDLKTILSAIGTGKKPLLFLASRTLDFGKLRTLESLLPFTWSNPSNHEMMVFADVPESQHSSILLRLGGKLSSDVWTQLPPVLKTHTEFRPKPEADILAFARAQSVVLHDPLLILRNIAGQRSFAITGHALWRWRLLAQGAPSTESFYSNFLTNVIRWLTTLDEGKNVRVVPTKETFTSAEPVEFTAELYDKQFRPVDAADVRLEILSKPSGQSVELSLHNIGSGRYEGSIDGLGAEDYSYKATATLDGAALGQDRGRFSVGKMNVEFLQTKMNRALLEQLAFRTGGLFFGIDESTIFLDSLRTRTHFEAHEVTDSTEVELWNRNYLAGLMIVLLAGEWFIRKKSGLV